MKVKINKHKLTDDKINVFNQSRIIYIPLISDDSSEVTVLVKKDEYVYKGTIIGKIKGKYRLPIYSSVSGRVLGFEEKMCYNGKKYKAVAIENDFKEKIADKIIVKKTINNYTKEQFIERIKECGIIGLGGAGYPTYLKYENKNINTLIINAVECEPYITSDETLTKNNCEEILETIDAILEINNIEKAIIVIKKNSELKPILDNFVGTYLKISVKTVADYYPIGWEKLLVKNIIKKEYSKTPNEIGVIVENISTIYAIYESLKYNKPLIDRLITFTGENLNKKTNLQIKIGTPIKDVLNYLEVKENSYIISGGPMMGRELEDFIITANINGVTVLPKINYKESKCIRCGKCVEVCPMKLSPVLIMDAVKKGIDIKKYRPEKCIECGLCSYICPANIPLRDIVKQTKKGSDN